MTFKEAAKTKFERGRAEHNQPWDKDHIDYLTEIQDELLDIYNYASLNPEDADMKYLMVFAEKTWQQLEKRQAPVINTPPEPNVCTACEG